MQIRKISEDPQLQLPNEATFDAAWCINAISAYLIQQMIANMQWVREIHQEESYQNYLRNCAIEKKNAFLQKVLRPIRSLQN